MTNPINAAFDINGTILDWNDAPIEPAIATLIFFANLRNVRVVLWSLRGREYAEYIADQLKLTPYLWQICGKDDADAPPVDIAFDDSTDFAKAKFNLIVRPSQWRKP